MSYLPSQPDLIITLRTFAVGALGAGIAYLLSFPLYLITGPAILVSLLGFSGLQFKIADPFRDAAFIAIGLSVGAGVNAEASDAFQRWPIAFLALAVMLTIALGLSCKLLTAAFGFDRRSAVLAAMPGHLSFVLSVSADLGANTGRVAAVQGVRILTLTLVVPLIALALGIDLGQSITMAGPVISLSGLALLIAISIGAGLLLRAIKVPAPLLIGAMAASSIAHLTDTIPGVMPQVVAIPGFIAIGTLIGTRFTLISARELRQSLLAGLASTAITATLSALFALPVAYFILMPPAHVLIAFSPGGLETMIAMGAMVGANAGFVAACHVGRLFLLTILLPIFLARAGKGE